MAALNRAGQARWQPLVRHRAFAVIVTLWLAALCGLSALVLTSSANTALGAGACGGLLGLVLARLASARLAPRSDRADEWADAAGPSPRSAALQIGDARPAFMTVTELGLASLDTRQADELPSGHPPDDPAADEPAPAGAAAVLKGEDVRAMSLVHMIERLALALEDRRRAGDAALHRAEPLARRGRPRPALVAQLRRLPVLTSDSFPAPAPAFATHGNAAVALSPREQAEETEHALREALEKLQQLSGG